MSILRCFINSTEYILTDTFNIREQAGQTATAKLDVKKGSNDVPVSHQRILVTESDGSTPVYLGLIRDVDPPVWSTGYETYVISLNTQSLEWLFDRRIVNESFSNKTVTELVTSLYNDYLDEDNVGLGNIGDFDRTFEKYVVPGLKLRKVLDELGSAVGATATIDSSGDFYFQDSSEFPELTPPTNISKLKKRESGASLRTVQRLTGANEETSQQTQSVTWSSSSTQILLGYQVSSVVGATINGNPVNVGLRGVDENDTSITFLYRYGSNTITVNPSATTKPAATDLVVFVYFGFFSVEIVSENEALKEEIATISGTSGKIESLQVDTSITNYEDGQNKADDMLDQYGEREETLSCFTVSDDIQSSRMLGAWTLNYTDLDVVGKYIIVERKITYYSPEKVRIDLKLKNKNFYSRYGTFLFKNDQQLNNLSVRTDDAVFKNSVLLEVVNPLDEFFFYNAGVIGYPANATGSMWDPANVPGSGEINEFYPV